MTLCCDCTNSLRFLVLAIERVWQNGDFSLMKSEIRNLLSPSQVARFYPHSAQSSTGAQVPILIPKTFSRNPEQTLNPASHVPLLTNSSVPWSKRSRWSNCPVKSWMDGGQVDAVLAFFDPSLLLANFAATVWCIPSSLKSPLGSERESSVLTTVG